MKTNKRFKIIITDEENPIFKEYGSFDDIEKKFKLLKLKYK